MLNVEQRYRAACLFDFYGRREQTEQTIQELAECIVALTKKDKHAQAEEIADSFVMLHQMVHGLDIQKEVVKQIEYKLKRQEDRIRGNYD